MGKSETNTLTVLVVTNMSSQQTTEATAMAHPAAAMMTRGERRENASNQDMMNRTAKKPERHKPANLRLSFSAMAGYVQRSVPPAMQKAESVVSHVLPSKDGNERRSATLAKQAASPGSMEAGAV